ncbi:hypothetical protein A4G18_07945 [Pasteurellaceae bacterium Pebbles2]|nr:hypothetical protein [Pasteurellaceae bacterium Pebbles2]
MMSKGYLREVVLDDARMILDWRNQDFVRNNMYNNNIIDYETHIQWLQKVLQDDTCKYFIYEKDSKPIGVVGFYNIDLNSRKASWAFYLGNEKARGAGVEMENLALDYAFNTLQIRKLCCEVLSFNAAVIEFHKKFGFAVEGIRKADYLRDGVFYDIYQMALFRDDYLDLLSLPNTKLAKVYAVEKNISNIETVNLTQDLMLNIAEYPGENYKLLNSDLQIIRNVLINGVVSIKGKLIFRSNEKAKVEYFMYYNDELIMMANLLFEQ